MGCATSLINKSTEYNVEQKYMIKAESITQVILKAVPNLLPDIATIVQNYCVPHLFIGCSHCSLYDVLPITKLNTTKIPRHECMITKKLDNLIQKKITNFSYDGKEISQSIDYKNWRLVSTGWNGACGKQLNVYIGEQEDSEQAFGVTIGFKYAILNEASNLVDDDNNDIEPQWRVYDTSLSYIWTPDYLLIFCWTQQRLLFFNFTEDAKHKASFTTLSDNKTQNKPSQFAPTAHGIVNLPPSLSQPVVVVAMPNCHEIRLFDSTEQCYMYKININNTTEVKTDIIDSIQEQLIVTLNHNIGGAPLVDTNNNNNNNPSSSTSSRPWTLCKLFCKGKWSIAPQVGCAIPSWVVDPRIVNRSVGTNTPHSIITMFISTKTMAPNKLTLNDMFYPLQETHPLPDPKTTTSITKSNFSFYVWTEFSTLTYPFNSEGKWMPQWNISLFENTCLFSGENTTYDILYKTPFERSALRLWFDYLTLELCLSAIVINQNTLVCSFVVCAAQFSHNAKVSWYDRCIIPLEKYSHEINSSSLIHKQFITETTFIPS